MKSAGWILAVCLALGFAAPTMALAPLAVGQKDVDAASLRARWESLSKAEQAELLARHKRLQALSPEKREELKNRAMRLRREMEDIQAELSEEELAELNKLGSEERRDALRAKVAERAAVAAAMVRTRMTPKERARIKAARPEERAKMLRILRQRELEGLSTRLTEVGKELGVPSAKLEELKSRPHDEQRAFIIARLRKRLERQVMEDGLPSDVPMSRWQRIQSMGDTRFLRSVERLRSRHPGFGVPDKQWAKRLKRRAGIAARLDALLEPSDEFAERFADRGEHFVRRRMIIDRRRRIEHILTRDLRLRADIAERLRALGADDFVAVFGVARKRILEGADVNAALGRWLDGRKRRRVKQGR